MCQLQHLESIIQKKVEDENNEQKIVENEKKQKKKKIKIKKLLFGICTSSLIIRKHIL
jgi:hypothetical protein